MGSCISRSSCLAPSTPRTRAGFRRRSSIRPRSLWRVLGAEVGDFELDPAAPEVFQWITADNSRHTMDAQTTVRFGYAALGHKQALIFAAFAIKSMNPIPADFADNSYWPA